MIPKIYDEHQGLQPFPQGRFFLLVHLAGKKGQVAGAQVHLRSSPFIRSRSPLYV
jgi:hypothetical protein